MIAGNDRFPFGAPSTLRPANVPPSGDTHLAVVGVYPSALHVRWDLPTWAVAGQDLPPRVGALAVDVEPTVFWDGTDPEPTELVAAWQQRVGFLSGDEPGKHGHVRETMNGTSGRSVVERVLGPLGVDPCRTMFTDLVPRFFVKTGTGGRAEQGDRIRDVYEPFARLVGLPPANLPARPAQRQLVSGVVTEERNRLRNELAAAGASVIVTLGSEAREALRQIVDDADGVPARDLRRDNYGEPGTLRIGRYRARWYALTHPGNRSPAWREVHAQWEQTVRPAG
ncbi:hypothetical protein [Egicoccus sp. AB-alg2]|uniref:hypothetical protein n=1 Tax=Egicoccus sp. AB-alg2 TaxID=3242693 RepID=UPI00359D6F53